MIEQIIQHPEQITFPVLFVGLLVYVMKTNDNREKQYRETIRSNNETIKKMTLALGSMEKIEHKVDILTKNVDKEV